MASEENVDRLSLIGEQNVIHVASSTVKQLARGDGFDGQHSGLLARVRIAMREATQVSDALIGSSKSSDKKNRHDPSAV